MSPDMMMAAAAMSPLPLTPTMSGAATSSLNSPKQFPDDVWNGYALPCYVATVRGYNTVELNPVVSF